MLPPTPRTMTPIQESQMGTPLQPRQQLQQTLVNRTLYQPQIAGPSTLDTNMDVDYDQMSISTASTRSHRDASIDYNQDRMSISTVSTNDTWGRSPSIFSHNDASSARFSIATSISSMSGGSMFSGYSGRQQPIPHAEPRQMTQNRPLRPAKHDPKAGLWNNVLRVIPCGKDHSGHMWNKPFPTCRVCGFSRWHALMIHARRMDVNTFSNGITQLKGISCPDFAGNYPIHFLMCAGVGSAYFERFLEQFLNQPDAYQNSFGQNPLHVLNPQDLGEGLIAFLEWFSAHRDPPGLLLTQRDINCRTPLHNLLQHPLERSLYRKILDTFPYSENTLRQYDTAGQLAIKMMGEAADKLKGESFQECNKLQAGIHETNMYLEETNNSNNSVNKYGFTNIARGGRGNTYFGMPWQCPICNMTPTQQVGHSNSYFDQMMCAANYGRDCNAPDATGHTPAHILVTKPRANNDPQQSPETQNQTFELFKILIPPNHPNLREALRVLDPQGNSLCYNVALNGFDSILKYIIEQEEPSRVLSMVNCCGKGDDGKERSVIEAVKQKIRDIDDQVRLADIMKSTDRKKMLKRKEAHLKHCFNILKHCGAQQKPDITTRWKIAS